MKNLPIVFVAALVFISACMQPHNNLPDCRVQGEASNQSKACYDFCDCIHQYGHSLKDCLDEYNKAPVDSYSNKVESLLPNQNANAFIVIGLE